MSEALLTVKSFTNQTWGCCQIRWQHKELNTSLFHIWQDETEKNLCDICLAAFLNVLSCEKTEWVLNLHQLSASTWSPKSSLSLKLHSNMLWSSNRFPQQGSMWGMLPNVTGCQSDLPRAAPHHCEHVEPVWCHGVRVGREKPSARNVINSPSMCAQCVSAHFRADREHISQR